MSLEDDPIATIQEGTAWGIQVVLYDKLAVLEVPSIISYTVHDEATGTQLIGTTTVPASTIEIPLPTSLNILQNSTKTEGTHVCTITCEYASPEDLLVIVTRWKIKRTKYPWGT